MTKEEIYGISFQLILHSGNARSFAMEAFQDAKNKDFEMAEQKIKNAEDELSHAHQYQTQLIQGEASGDELELPIILIHAQDHLMTAMTLKDVAVEMIELRKELFKQNK